MYENKLFLQIIGYLTVFGPSSRPAIAEALMVKIRAVNRIMTPCDSQGISAINRANTHFTQCGGYVGKGSHMNPGIFRTK